jgi:hypothetical protein
MNSKISESGLKKSIEFQTPIIKLLIIYKGVGKKQGSRQKRKQKEKE